VEGVIRSAGVAENPLRHGARKSAAPPPPTVEELFLPRLKYVNPVAFIGRDRRRSRQGGEVSITPGPCALRHTSPPWPEPVLGRALRATRGADPPHEGEGGKGQVRRRFLAGALAAAASPAFAAPAPVVTMLGDSITAGYGLPAAAALPARLQVALARLGIAARVRGAGVSGDTSGGGLGRLDFSVQPDTSVCVVALGGNDLLQGLDPKAMRANLGRIVARLEARRIRVVLAGIAAPPAIGRAYARDFDAVFPAVAHAHGAALYPNLLAGVARDPGLNQRDGIHPNAAGVDIIAARLAPVVARALKSRR